MLLGPVSTNICPINHGRNILPIPDPTSNQPVIVPVTFIRSAASIMLVGNMDAIDNPNPIVPIHRARSESFHVMIIMVPTAQPIKSMNSMVCDRARVETQMPISLLTVKDPQNAEVR